MLILAMALSAAAAPAPAGNWVVGEKTAQIDGRRTYNAVVAADAPVRSLINTEEKPVFVAQCDGNILSVAITWPDLFAASIRYPYVNIRWKVDDGGIQVDRFRVIERLAVIQGKEAAHLLTQLHFGKRLIVSVPDRHGAQEAVFAIAGSDEISAQLRARGCLP